MKRQHYVLFRTLTSLIFLYAGFGHVVQPAKILGKFSKAYFYTLLPHPSLATILIIASGIVMLIAGLMLAAGFYQKQAAVTLLAVLIPITLSVQLENLNDLGPFFKNVAIAGSLLFIINYKFYETKTSVVRSGNTFN